MTYFYMRTLLLLPCVFGGPPVLKVTGSLVFGQNQFRCGLDSHKNFFINDPKNRVLLGFGQDSVTVRNMAVDDIQTSRLSRGIPQWIMWSLETFDEPEHKWKPKKTQTCGNSLNKFLGGHCTLGAEQKASRHYKGLPTHTQLRVSGLVHFFDEWKGETVYLTADDSIRWSHAYDWCDGFFTQECKNKALDFCGRMFPDKLSHYFSVEIPHQKTDLWLEIASTLGAKPACDASFGIDDILIELK